MIESDRELLELAVKAYGDAPLGFSPLTDDGDALRLAVELRIAIDPREYDVCGACAITEDGVVFVEDPRNQNPDVATRRVVVRAAAYIGKNKK